MKFDKKLMERTEKIFRALDSIHSCCGDMICRSIINREMPEELIKAMPDIMALRYQYRDTMKFIIYETLRLSQTRKK